MDFSLIHLIIAIVTALGAWIGFIEKRLHTMYANIKEKIEDKDRVNQVVQQELKEHIVRLEEKIDMLIRLNLKDRHDDRNS